MFHSPPFRHAVVVLARGAWRGVRFVLWELPQAAWRSPAVRAVRYSGPVRFFHRRLVGAVVFAAGVVLALTLLGAPIDLILRWGGGVFAAAVLVLNTSWGWVAQERLLEELADWWRVVRVNLLPGLLATILDTFRRLANWVERRLYAVDEWLRFRGGESRRSLAVKAGLGLVWFPVAYLSRFAFYLLIEPQINPVKHFPVVTVSHKVILPMTPTVADALGVSEATAAGLLGCIPGIFGFIAWELMANWRLYEANRPDRLRPVTIGSHGETMRGLLRPGFHSGTVPKLFKKMRAAERRGTRDAAAGIRHELEHAGQAVERFVSRELLRLLGGQPGWGTPRAVIQDVRFGCQRVVIEVAAPGIGHGLLVVAFENRGGRIEADIVDPGWSNRLSAEQRAALSDALRGLFDMAAAELYEGHERRRDPDPADGSDLLRPYLWDEWVARWTAPPDPR